MEIAIQWQSGAIEFYPVRFELGQACRLVRELSECSPSIKRVWLETANGALVYSAEQGHGRNPKLASCDFAPPPSPPSIPLRTFGRK